ncbi:Glutamic acid-rich protein-like [Heracleum sosnowskyi]|uniref:Glutamic acid-rich protein-like n=1 Tax=Heracleum sosnowskyi TaxID=360622 RepID=A0AAD8MRP6_9APIA|nr:Glutamic acid-rich protein-like [Heracleum sosnowskyi]
MLATGARTIFPLCKTNQENQISHFSHFPTKISPTHLIFHSNKLTHFGFCVVLGKIRNGSGLFATKSSRKCVNVVFEVEGFDSDDEFDEEEGEFDEDEDLVVPMRNMKKWLENKPLGFGEGKEYDTTIEDKLAEEIEQQSRVAQLADLNKLKNNPQSGNSKNQQKPKGLVNLPKKKNIIRDQQRAFKGFPGMINIVPVVSGNKKTREPICTGIAFI